MTLVYSNYKIEGPAVKCQLPASPNEQVWTGPEEEGPQVNRLEHVHRDDTNENITSP